MISVSFCLTSLGRPRVSLHFFVIMHVTTIRFNTNLIQLTFFFHHRIHLITFDTQKICYVFCLVLWRKFVPSYLFDGNGVGWNSTAIKICWMASTIWEMVTSDRLQMLFPILVQYHIFPFATFFYSLGYCKYSRYPAKKINFIYFSY